MAKRFLATALLAAAWLLLPSLAEGGTLRILTYNIHHGAGTDNFNHFGSEESPLNWVWEYVL